MAESPREGGTSLKTLLAAALALPGLTLQPALADDGGATASFQYSHYREGARDIGGMNSKFSPIEAESLHQGLRLPLEDGWKGVLNVSQDSWSGATPVATAPSSARGNRINTTHVMTGASMDGMTHDHSGMDEDGNPLPEEVHVSTGASPYLYSSLKLDAALRPLRTDSDGKVTGGIDTALVHTLSSASRELRQQLDAAFTRELTESAYDLGGGFSREPDFESLFGNVAGHWNVNRRQTTLHAGLGFTGGRTDARLDHDATPHVYEPYMYMYERPGSDAVYNDVRSNSRMSPGADSPVITGTRTDWTASLGLTQALNRSALLEASLGYTRSRGYLDNPYKAVEVAFIDPLKQSGQAGGNSAADYLYDAELVALMETRPDLRNQGVLNLRYVQHVARTDAALHADYRYFQDDWGIRSHTLETQWVQPLPGGWRVTPKLRYYTQTAARFYTPYLVTRQGLYNGVTDPVLGTIYLNARSPGDGQRYYEDPTGAIAPPLDPDPDSGGYGKAVVGPNGHALINRDTGQAVDSTALASALKQDTTPFDRSRLPSNYSSDPRLSGFGNLSAGLVLTRQLAKGMALEMGYEHLRHAGSLKLGGGGEGSYADYDADWFNVALTVDLDAANALEGMSGMAHHHHGASHHPDTGAPAGVQLDHVLATAGDLMVAYRYQMSLQSGAVTDGGGAVDDYTLINRGCGAKPCYVRPTRMDMRMHMLDVMYAWNDRLTLMLMPQFMDMRMSMRLLDGSPRTGGMDATGMAITHSAHPHVTSGLGDTEVQALLRLGSTDRLSWHAGLGLSMPTGDTAQTMRSMMGIDMGVLDYGMQLGSGTWDLKPGLTVTGRGETLRWGAQLSGIRRLQRRNDAGYALGDVIQTTAWGSREWRPGLSASLRAAYTRQGAVRGSFTATQVPISIGDYPSNYGGNFLDLGVGINRAIQGGPLAGNRLGLEWVQPVKDEPNGNQLKRTGTLVLNWAIHL